MDRKEFILKSAGAAAAVSVSSLLKAGSLVVSQDDEHYIYVFTTKETRSQELSLSYTFFIPKSIDQGLVSAIKMDMTQATNVGLWNKEASYEIQVKKVKASKDGHTILKCEAYELKDGDDILSLSELSILGKKKNCILYFPETDQAVSTIQLLDNKNTKLATVLIHIPSTGGGCFLTSACLKEIGKDERCFELVELERFAQQHVATSKEGKEMLKLYYGLAPMVVEQINASPNRVQIWRKMYDDLVVPTLTLIEEKQFEDAKKFYSSYSYAIYRSMI